MKRLCFLTLITLFVLTSEYASAQSSRSRLDTVVRSRVGNKVDTISSRAANRQRTVLRITDTTGIGVKGDTTAPSYKYKAEGPTPTILNNPNPYQPNPTSVYPNKPDAKSQEQRDKRDKVPAKD